MDGGSKGWFGRRYGAVILSILGCLCWSVADPAYASGEVNVGLSAEAGYQFGYNRWNMLHRQGAVTVESELDWPLNFPLGGFGLDVSGPLAQDKTWRVVFSFLTNMTNPSGTMDDSDWIGDEAIGLRRTLWSYTQSAVQGHAFLFDLGSYFNVWSRKSRSAAFCLDVGAGYRHEFYVLNAQGAEGWQLNIKGERIPVQIPETIRGIHYEVNHMLPFVGVQSRNRFGEHLVLDGGVRMFGVIARDIDDHLLRNKEATGNAGGLGVGVSVAPRFVVVPPTSASKASLTLGVDLDFEYLSAPWGTLSQYFYGDDPGSPDDETGVVLPDSEWSFDSMLFRALAVLEVRM